ncbi:MAG: hypothetical protein WBV39_04340 [Rudaea sp.]
MEWVAPHRITYSVGERFGGADAPLSTGELYAVNDDGTDAKILFAYRAGDGRVTHLAHAAREPAFGSLIRAVARRFEACLHFQ